jgi:prepilin-type N-terminal cleavage/methylation domain-containing protein
MLKHEFLVRREDAKVTDSERTSHEWSPLTTESFDALNTSCPKWTFGTAGFSLIELMIVVAVLASLTLIVAPKFANMIEKAREATIKGRMGAIRSAVTIYYADNEGFLPDPLSPPPPNAIGLPDILIPRYLGTEGFETAPNGRHTPQFRTRYHARSSTGYNHYTQVQQGPGPYQAPNDPAIFNAMDEGLYLFYGYRPTVNGPLSVLNIMYHCQHKMSNGVNWTAELY